MMLHHRMARDAVHQSLSNAAASEHHQAQKRFNTLCVARQAATPCISIALFAWCVLGMRPASSAVLLQATGMQEYESAIAPLKQALFSQLFAPLEDGADRAADASSSSSSTADSYFKVLEVGIGTGEQPQQAS
jgi:hypothetical protein